MYNLTKEELEEFSDTVYYNFEEDDDSWVVTRENNTYTITGKGIEKVMRRINFSDNESLAYFHLMLKKMGIEDELKRKGIREGDIVKIFDWEFEYES